MATPFDYTKSILTNKEYIMKEGNEGEYVPFVVNRVLSNYPDCIFYVQEMNMNPHLSPRMQYDYYYHSIRKSRRPFVPYPKQAKDGYISLLMEAYGYSPKKAREAADILTEEQLEEIKKIYTTGDG